MSVQDIPKLVLLKGGGGVHDGNDLVGGESKEGEHNVESLMQERDGDSTVTIDEHTGNSTQEVLTHSMLAPPSYPANLCPSSHMPDLPMVSPLQLVYLQPTPHGVNIIPVQGAGPPSFTPISPLGFPAHPNHPVVVQQGQFYRPQVPLYYHHQPPTYYSPVPHPTIPMYPTCYPGTPVKPYNMGTEPFYRPQPRFFRPWEDKEDACCPHKDCGGSEDHHTQTGSHEQAGQGGVPSFGEEDFPALSQQMSSMNIKK